MGRQARGFAYHPNANPDRKRLSLRMVIRNGELYYRQLHWRSDFVTDAETAIERLRAGKVVWVVQVGPLITTIQRAIAIK